VRPHRSPPLSRRHHADPGSAGRIRLPESLRKAVAADLPRDPMAELGMTELEERIAPRLASNHNETLLAE
jgi:hypothetical protein